jgi:hypothetical protein
MTMTRNAITILVSVALGVAIGVVVGTHVGVSRHESPYLKHPDRLGDVVAALSVMGTHEYDAHTPDKWQEFIGARPKSAASWKDVFNEHSEFFRTTEDKERFSLVWRRARDRVYDTVTRKELSEDEIRQLRLSDDARKVRLSRAPLTPDDTMKLIEVAINMQTRAIARREELRWWVPVLVGVVCVFIGARLKS